MERTQILTLPIEYDREELLIPKEKNPNIVYILKHPEKIVWYKDTHKGFFYTVEGLYIGQFDLSHLKRMYNRIGNVLRLISIEKKRKKALKLKKKKIVSEKFFKGKRNEFKNEKGDRNSPEKNEKS